MVLTRPTEAFTAMRTEGGLGDPLLFGVIGGSIGAIVWIRLLSAAIHSLGWAARIIAPESISDSMLGASLGGAMLVVRLIMAPIFIAIGMFIWASTRAPVSDDGRRREQDLRNDLSRFEFCLWVATLACHRSLLRRIDRIRLGTHR